MATYQRPPSNPVVDAQRSSRWPIVLFVILVVAVIGGGIAYDRYVANAPIVLTPTKPDRPTTTRPSQSTAPSPQPTRPSQSRPTQTSSGVQDWLPIVMSLIPLIFIGAIVLIGFTFVRRIRRAAMNQAGTANPIGHWSGGQHRGPGEAAAGPWARQPGTVATTTTTPTPSSQPVKRRGGGFPLLPIVIGAIIIDQAMFNGRYSREALNWIMRFIDGFTR